MNWIKVFHDLPDKPAVHQMAATLNLTPEDVVGRLVRLWVWADQTATVNDEGDAEIGVTPVTLLDSVTRYAGFAAALEKVGWLRREGDKLTLPGYGHHNGDTARARALNAERQSRYRQRQRERNASRNALHNAEVTPPERELEGDKSKKVDNTNPPTPLPGGAPKPVKIPKSYPETPGFTKWYALYPRRQGKADAIKAWHQVDGESKVDLLIEEVRIRVETDDDWHRDGGRYIPLPASWLRGRRWEDEPIDLGLATAAAANVPERKALNG